MGFSFFDLIQMGLPIAASALGGPVAGIAAGALMKGGRRAAQGGDLAQILRDTALGGASGAAGAGTAAAISKGAGQLATETAERGIEKATEAMAEAGTKGFADATEQAMKHLTRAGTRQRLAEGVSGAFSKSMGQDAQTTAKLLEIAQKGGDVAGAASDVYNLFNQPPRFSFMAQRIHGPGSFGGPSSFGAAPTVGLAPSRFGIYGGY